jgi:sugar phosphate isomerase/epimerase
VRERLGIVTNCLARRLEKGDAFEALILAFGREGFTQVEIRDGDYLRASDFGELLDGLEALMGGLAAADWKKLCRRLREPAAGGPVGEARRDQRLIERASRFLGASRPLVMSFATAHPWLSVPSDPAADSERIARAKRLAYLLCPEAPRLRLVDPAAAAPPSPAVAVANLKRYQALAPELAVGLAVENARFAAEAVLEIAVKAGVRLAYDEANCFAADGSPLGSSAAFWSAVHADQLASVHLKQKTAAGVAARLAEGWVDIPALLARLAERGYQGDLLLEYSATDQPLEDALASWRYLMAGG